MKRSHHNFYQFHILHFYHLSLMDYIIGPQLNPWSPGYDGQVSEANI